MGGWEWWVGGGGGASWGVSPNHCVLQPLIECSVKCQKKRKDSHFGG